MFSNDVDIGERIKTVRKSLGLTQDQLAEKSELSSNYIGQLERGERSPSLKTLSKIARSLGVDTEYLVRSPHGDIETKLREIRRITRTPENLDKVVKIARIIFDSEDGE